MEEYIQNIFRENIHTKRHRHERTFVWNVQGGHTSGSDIHTEGHIWNAYRENINKEGHRRWLVRVIGNSIAPAQSVLASYIHRILVAIVT